MLPLESACTGLALSIWEAMVIFPQGEDVVGCWASAALGVPETPRAGEITLWALFPRERPRRSVG